MSDTQQHLYQYRHNKELLQSSEFEIDKTNHLDWVITIAFYSAIHLVEKELANMSCHSKSHENRNEIMCMFAKFDKIGAKYATLEMLSKKARYYCVGFTKTQVREALNLLTDIEEVTL
jgi:hypothetical protein